MHSTNLFITSLKYYSYQMDTFIGNTIQLSTFIELLYYYTFYPLPCSIYGGVLEYKQNCCGMFTYLHKHKEHIQ